MINRLTGKDEKSVKVVIEILEYDYKNLMIYKDNSNGRNWAEQRIIAGTPLPKGHGRLIDADKLEYTCNSDECGMLTGCNHCQYHIITEDEIDNADTIIEADTERSEKEE